ncbi:MAG: hypothetical protein II414_07145, partial [Erysipelotrichaceae bacterium]|nr:hypothetical protein [Erysipelotrichaceae bacterium]
VNVTITNCSVGPSITRYELQPDQGVRVNKILSLENDIKMALVVYSSEIGQLNQFYLCAGTGAFWTPVPVLFGQASSGFRMYLFEIFQFLLLPPIVTDFLMHASAN